MATLAAYFATAAAAGATARRAGPSCPPPCTNRSSRPRGRLVFVDGDAVAAAARRVLEIEPGFSVEAYASRLFPPVVAEARYRAALRAAGLP